MRNPNRTDRFTGPPRGRVTRLGREPCHFLSYIWRVDLSESYKTVIPRAILTRYEIRETRNAAAILQATNPHEFKEVLGVLGEFKLSRADIIEPGKNKSLVARRLDDEFRGRGWREGSHDMTLHSVLTVRPHKAAGERKPTIVETEVISAGYKVDNVKGRVALDVEWNAKDGNLDRDVGAYRALYDAGIIDAGIIITREHESIRNLARRLRRPRGFATTTTTTLEKLVPRITRGDGGGCPLLAFAITDRCYSPRL
ncbi:MAG: BglII/BstYI family type II restriction endonuclease [Actinomycetota bacterium]